MDKKELSDIARGNRLASLTHAICVVWVLILSLLDFTLNNAINAGTYTMYCVLGLVPVILEGHFWRKDHDTKMIKHLVGVGFALFYAFLSFTCTNNLQFTFVIPMILVISIFNDTSFSVKINIGTVIISLITGIGGALTGKFAYETTDDAIIQIVVMIIIAVASYMTAKVSRENSQIKIDEARNAQKQAADALEEVTMVSRKMHDGIKNIYEELEKLNKATLVTRNSMDELSSGATHTAEAVQNQTYQTEEIQTKVDMVTDVSEQISESMKQTLEVLKQGNKDVDVLLQQVDDSVTKGAEVADKLQNLDQYVEEMHSIVKMISGIANQTSMLALNASIEAARAGESGRGFAVVASQVTSMAKQTKDATVNISELIENVSNAISDVVEVISSMLEGIKEEKQSTDNTVESFGSIQANTLSTEQNMVTLENSIHQLKEANHVIVESIATISATTQEVSAHAVETVEATKNNEEIIGRIDNMMQELIQYIRLEEMNNK